MESRISGKEMQMIAKPQLKQVDQKRIQIFLELKQQPIEALRDRAVSLGLDDGGDSLDIVRRIANASLVPQVLDGPQVFALKSTGNPEAQQFYRRANAKILPQEASGRVVRTQMRKKPFTFQDKNGVNYVSSCPYVALKPETALLLLQKGWIHALDNQRQVLSEMQKNISQFSCYLIRKKTTDGKFYLMMYSERKK